jgi:AcrR family transcriptional regulator
MTPSTPALRYGTSDDASTAGETRDAVLASARRLFAQQGFQGASVRAITDDAGANLGAVTYHFGSKEELYVEVLKSAMSPLRDRVYEAVVRERTPVDRVAGIMRAFFEHFRANPDAPRLMLQRIAAGQRAGQIREGHPVRLALSVVAQPIYMSLIRPILTPLTRNPDLADLDPLVKQAEAFLRAGLRGEKEA